MAPKPPPDPPRTRDTSGTPGAAGRAAPGGDDRLVQDVFDASKHDEVAAAVAKLRPEEAAYFLAKLEAAVTKRKVQLTGYLVAMVVWLAGMIGALVYYGTHDGFVGWIFLVPFALVGAVLWAFGAWSEKVAARIRAAGGVGPGGPGGAAAPGARDRT